jgi:hypothetical protein
MRKGQRTKDKGQNRTSSVALFAAVAVSASVGLAGMSSLKIMPGAREAAMGNAGCAAALVPEAIAWNPAAGSEIESFALRAGYTKWLLDSHQQSLFVVRNFGFAHLGLGITSLTAGRFEYRTEIPTEDPIALFTPAEFGFHVNLSRRFGTMVNAGLTVRYYYTKILEEDASGPGVDLGVRVRPVDGLALGVSLTDFGRNLVYYRESFRLPTRARLGAAYSRTLGAGLGFELAADGAYFVYDKTFNVQTGLELDWRRLLFARAWYEWLGASSRLGFGLGLALGRFQFDYALTGLNDNLGAAHRISIALGR